MIQYISITNYPITNATSYELLEITENEEYKSIPTAKFIDGKVNLTDLGLSEGEYKFVVQAHSDNTDYESSKYSNSVLYSVLEEGNTDSGTENPEEGEGENTDSETYKITYESYFRDSSDEEYKKADDPTTYFTYENIQSITKGQSYENTFITDQDFFDKIEVYIGNNTTPLTFDETSITIDAAEIIGDLLIKMYSYDRASSN